MIILAPILTRLEVKSIKIVIPIEYPEDVPENLPGFDDGKWTAVVNLETGAILDWPKDFTKEPIQIFQKIRDSGIWSLLDNDGRSIADRDWYVPNFIPKGGGDYLDLHVNTDGVIANWTTPSDDEIVCFFFGTNDDD